tara:strand:- start:1680 stop:1931 length:252 start_codon:yes stop_codon:yes gene_type:complete
MPKTNLSENEIVEKIKKKIKKNKINENTICKIFNKILSVINKYSDKSDDNNKIFAISILEQLIRESNITSEVKENLTTIIQGY